MTNLRMTPVPGARLARYVGDRVRFELTSDSAWPDGARAYLRTNLTRAEVARREVIAQAGLREMGEVTFAGASFRDLPLERVGAAFAIELPLLEVGHFRAKVYLRTADGRAHWPDGPDAGISVHPDALRSGNVIYCAFVRNFGPTRTARETADPSLDARVRDLEQRGFTVLPPSGRLRDLTAEVPHVFDTLGCRVLHLLPIGPTPTTYARMGRFGSPYAQLDLVGIDPALVEFDGRTTAVDQFVELADAVHARDGRLILDVVLNHTGWSSTAMETHPEWFRREPDGRFRRPGAWGVVWEDLVELDHADPALWDMLATSLLVWCRRGVDGFRCDAAYMVPLAAWQYVVARVRVEFPECIFLAEGLGGAYEATAALLSEGGMQWAYSELFQNHAPREVSGYLDHAMRESVARGALVHYAETHDNDRLAKRGASFARFRNRLCALTSVSGAYGYSAGVEWLADEKIDVHDARGLAFGSEPNLVHELGALARLLADDPCFADGARMERLSPPDSELFVLVRTSADGSDRVLVVANLRQEGEARFRLDPATGVDAAACRVDRLTGAATDPSVVRVDPDGVELVLPALTCLCLSDVAVPRGLRGAARRAMHARAAFALTAAAAYLPAESLGPADPSALAALLEADPVAFTGALAHLDPDVARRDLMAGLRQALAHSSPPSVVVFEPTERPRVVPRPPGHALLVMDARPFRVRYEVDGDAPIVRRSIVVRGTHVAFVPPRLARSDARHGRLEVRVVAKAGETIERSVLELAPEPRPPRGEADGILLLTNGRGAYCRVHSSLGLITSKYDAFLAANLHPSVPCDRHVFVKRMRVWANADGFLGPLDATNRVAVTSGPPASLRHAVHAGDGRTVPVSIALTMLPDENAVRVALSRPRDPIDAGCPLALTVRFDLEDRSFHAETIANDGADAHFRANVRTCDEATGFVFAPSHDRAVAAVADAGRYHDQPEWSRSSHPLERERGMLDVGDAYSPGWFELELAPGDTVHLVVVAGARDAAVGRADAFLRAQVAAPTEPAPESDAFATRLASALDAFVVRRGAERTVIAGYPWFLDWGRDSLIVARGLVAAGRCDDAWSIVSTFAGLERGGTLPNALSAESTADRDTSDAPLLLGLVSDELAASVGPSLYDRPVADGRRLRDVLASIVRHHVLGAENGVRVDPDSGLVFSPTHFTWMDTRHPAGTPREGYPIEIAAYFIRLLAQLERHGIDVPGVALAPLRRRAQASLARFVLPDRPVLGDVLLASFGVAACDAVLDDALRPNALVPIALGLVEGEVARATVEAARRWLFVPGAMRSLAPASVRVPLRIEHHGVCLGDPSNPYRGRYEGDEDTSRKPAYHNGTAWVWLLPTFCEAYVRAYGGSSSARATARAMLGSAATLLDVGTLGNLPEILDGDAPHRARGCDAQAWSVSETLRVELALASQAKRSGIRT